MMKEYKQWYLSVGIRKKVNFLNPLIIDGDTFFLPKNSTLHFNTFSENLAGPTSKDFMFSAERKVVVNNMLKYSGIPIGNFRIASGVNTESVSKKLKLERGKNSIVFTDKAIKVSDTELLVYNYNSLLSSYIYTNHPLILHFKWSNTINSIIENVNNNLNSTRRNQFILLEIPNSIPKKDTLIEKAKKEDINKQTLEIFNTYKLLTLLDFWKYLNLELHSDSMFSKLDKNKLDKVNIVFKYKNKYIVLNLAVLFHMANLYLVNKDMELPDKKKEYDVDISKLDFKQARAALILLFNKAIANDALSFAMLEQGTTDTVNTKMANGMYNSNVLKAINSDRDEDVELDEDLLEELNNDYTTPTVELPDIAVVEEEVNDKDEDFNFDDEAEDANDLEKELKDIELSSIDEEVDEEFNTIESVMIEDKKKTRANTVDKIKKAASNGELSKNMSEQLINLVENQDILASPYINEERYLGEMLDIKTEEIQLKPEDLVIPAVEVPSTKFVDKDTKDKIEEYFKQLEIYNKNVLGPLDKHYVKNLHKRYLVSTIYKMQDAGLIITDYKVTEDKDALGAYELHTFETTTLKGKKNKNTIKLPTLAENGEFSQSGNHYKFRRQFSDVPLRKIDFNKVVLSSYFGKLFVTKADSKLKDFGYWLSKQLSLMSTEEYGSIVTNLIVRDSMVYDGQLPADYTYFSRYIKSFNFKGWKYEFHYPSRLGLINNDKELLKKIEKDGKYTLVAVNSNATEYYALDNNSVLYTYSGNSHSRAKSAAGSDIFNILGIDTKNAPSESLIIKLFRKKLPLVLLLSYNVGIMKLLRLLKVDYKIVGKRDKYDRNNYDGYTFKNSKLLISKNYTNKTNSLIFAGFDLMEKEIKDVELKSLNSKSTFSLLFSNLDLDKTYINEIALLESMFIDPITETILKALDMPTTFSGLLIKSAELLADDNYKNPVYDGELLIKSSERMVGFMYNELVKSIRAFKNKEDFARANFTIEPYAVWKIIGDDSTSIISKKLNPVDSLKQVEEATKIGQGGMNKDSVTKSARAYHSSAVGIVSEATKDSSAVGISAYLSATPNLTNVLGIKSGEETNGVSGRFSTSALLSPFVEYEAPKRAGFISIQNGHVAPIINAELPYIRTIEEMTICYRVGREFAFMAQQDGIVTKITDSVIEVEYRDKTKDAGLIGDWSTRPESGKAFKNTIKTDLKENDRFRKGDAIAYNTAFFQKDFLFKNKLVYKMATYANVGLTEEEVTKEDSSVVSKAMYSKLVTQIYYAQGFIFKATDILIDIPKENTKLKPDTYLYTIMNNNLSEEVQLSSNVIESLQEIKNNSAVSGKEGTLDFIEIFYNSFIDDLSDTFKNLLKNKKLVRKAEQVTNQYSVDGRPLAKGEVHVIYYIASKQEAGGGEKVVLANQLKSIVGDVVTYQMISLGGIELDMLFSKLSVENRVVNSAYIMGTANLLLDLEAKELLKIWNS